MRAAFRPLFFAPYFGAVGVSVFFVLSLISEVFCFLRFGLARLAEQLLRTCRRSYCPKVVKRIAKNRNYLLWAFCSFFLWSFSFVIPHFPCVLVLVLGGGVPVEEQGTSFGVIIGKNL